MLRKVLLCLALGIVTPALAQTPYPSNDASPHTARVIEVEKDVSLEVLDWGGNGRPLILLSGLGSTAHAFDTFAPKLAGRYHVYGITRRGYGASSRPEPTGDNYSATRLGQDVVAVMDFLKIERSVLAGWSFGGEELSAVSNRYPARVAGLIYLDAAYSYAFYASGNVTPTHVNLDIDARELELALTRMDATPGIKGRRAIVQEVLSTILPNLETDLRAVERLLSEVPEYDDVTPSPETAASKIFLAIFNGVEKQSAPKSPILAIFSLDQGAPLSASAKDIQRSAALGKPNEKQADRFQAGNPLARVVRIRGGRHDVFNSNEADVLREMNSFIATLP